MLESLWIGAFVVEFIYNCFILLINVNDLELQYVNVVNIYTCVFIRSMTITKSCRNKKQIVADIFFC